MLTKTTIRYHYTLSSMAIIIKEKTKIKIQIESNEPWKENGESGSSWTTDGNKYKTVQPLWKTVFGFSKCES